jgi:hypothetical protein
MKGKELFGQDEEKDGTCFWKKGYYKTPRFSGVDHELNFKHVEFEDLGDT